MEFWFVILLSVIAVLAIGLLLYFELMGDDSVRLNGFLRKRGESVKEQSAVICQTIKDTVDPMKAYSLFVEYIFINNRQFLEYVKKILREISRAYNSADAPALHACLNEIDDMNSDLLEQKKTQKECMATIDSSAYIETSAWLHLSNSCRVNINDGLLHMAQVCIEYPDRNSEPFPDKYNEQLEYLLNDVCLICDTCLSLIGTKDINGMRELRKRMSVILDESYANTQRLYELLHDGLIELTPQKRCALRYALNALQELHCMIYTLRRFVLANIGITLSIMPSDATGLYPSSPSNP